jgi:hypothetical protein
MVYAGLVAFMLRTEAAQGRLLFPAILLLGLGLAYGLSQLLRWLAGLAPALGLVTAVYCLFFVIRPTYALPPLMEQLSAAAVPLNADVAEGLTLVGAEIETETAVPGEVVWLTLYWQRTGPVNSGSPEFVLELLGQGLERVSHLHSYHGRCLYPAVLWPAGEIIADRFAVRVDETAIAPVLARVFVGLAQAEIRVEVGEVKLVPVSWPEAADEALAHIGAAGEVALVETAVMPTIVHPGQQIQIDLTWRVEAPPGEDWTTFLHLAEAGQPPLAQSDAPPRQGFYPTRIWQAGEIIADRYWVTVPDGLAAGRYPLWLGMYESQTNEQLPLSSRPSLGSERELQADSTFLLTWITVEQ